MSVSLKCPSCEKRLSVPDAMIGKDVRCPGCRKSFKTAIPPPSEQEPLELPDDEEEDHVSALRRFWGKSRLFIVGFGSTVAIGLIIVIVVLFTRQTKDEDHPEPVAIATGKGVIPVQEDDRQEQIAARVDLLCYLVRQGVVSQQIGFWNQEEIGFWNQNGVAFDLDDLVDEHKRSFNDTKSLQNKLNERWGDRLKGLGTLDPSRANRFKTFDDGKEQLVGTILDSHYKILNLECEQFRAKLAVDNPLVLSEMPKFDRETVGGKIAYDEWQIRKPPLDKKARADREVKIALAYANGLPALIKKRINTCRDECRQAVAKLEEEFRKVR